MAEGAVSAQVLWLQWGFPFQVWLGGLGLKQKEGVKEVRGDDGMGQEPGSAEPWELWPGEVLSEGERWTCVP